MFAYCSWHSTLADLGRSAAFAPSDVRFSGTDPSAGTGYLVRRGDLAKVHTSPVVSRNEWSIDVVRSPGVEFMACFFDGTVLRRGRVYAVTTYYDETNALRSKEPESVNAVNGIMRAVKRMCRRLGSCYIGPAAEEWMKANNASMNVAGYEIRRGTEEK